MLYYVQERGHFDWMDQCGILSSEFFKNTMHELPITQNILKIALEYGEKSSASRITDIHLVIGQLSTVIDESVQFYWPIVSEGTIAENALLHFKRIPARLCCTQCDTVYMIDDGYLSVCPECDSSQVKIVAGNEFQLESIQIDT
jgi:hydrogenase nickel incorporation protein HypA/HybF